MKKLEAARVRLVAAFALAAVLTACGGGGSDAPPAPPLPTAIPESLAITAPAINETTAAAAFTNSAASLTGLTFAWNFGDGATSAEASPRHSYAKAGDFEVSLKVTNAAGTSKEVKFKLAVNNRTVTTALSCSGESQGGWCWQAPRPSGNQVGDTYFVSALVGWTVGDSGDIHKTVDGGRTWTRQASGVTAQLSTVRFADANNGWVLGGYGALLRTTDGGAHWTLQAATPSDSYSTRLTVVNATTAILVSNGSSISATADGGATWTQSTPNAASLTVATDGTIWAVGYDSLRKSADLGKTWTVVRSFESANVPPALAVQGSTLLLLTQRFAYDPAQGYTYPITLQRSSDGGATWATSTPQGLPAAWSYITDIDFRDASVGSVALGADLYRTADGALTWTKLDGPADQNYVSLDRRVLAPGVRYRGYYNNSYTFTHQVSDDEGATWRTITAPSRGTYSSYWSVSKLQRIDAQTWMAVAESAVWLSTDGMRTWSVLRGQSTTATPRNFNALWFFDATRGLALTQYGELLETKNGGLDWAVKLTGLPSGYASAARMQFVNATRGWLMNGDGRLYASTDAGERWSAPLGGLGYTFRNFHFVDANIGFATATDANYYQYRLLATTDGGLTWTVQTTLTDDVRALHFTSATQGVMVGYSGRVMTTSDGGKTWINRYSGTGAALNSLASSEAGLWAVGESGVVLNSKDSGVTWTLLAPQTTASLQKVRFLDSRQGWIVGYDGTILATLDGGKTWKAQDAATRTNLTDVFFADSRTGWVAGESASLLVTGTGGL